VQDLFCSLLRDVRRPLLCLKVPMLRPLVLLIRVIYRRRSVWNIGEMIMEGQNRRTRVKPVPLQAAKTTSPLVDCVWNVMAHAQKPDFVFRGNGRVHLNRQGRRWVDGIRMDLQEVGCGYMDCTGLAQWRTLVSAVMNLRVPWNAGNFLTSCKPVSFSRRTLHHWVSNGRQFSRLLAAEVCASAVVMLDTPWSAVVWRVLATHSIRQFPLHFPSRASPCAITFQLDSTTMPADVEWHLNTACCGAI